MIRASELGEYVYCRRAWWLHHVLGHKPAGRARREQGIVMHEAHGRRVQASSWLVMGGAMLGLAALLLLLLA